jgi:hypothetical protein
MTVGRCWISTDHFLDPLAISTGSKFRQETTGLTESAATISFSDRSLVGHELKWDQPCWACRVKHGFCEIYIFISTCIIIYILYYIVKVWPLVITFKPAPSIWPPLAFVTCGTGCHTASQESSSIRTISGDRLVHNSVLHAQWHHDSIWGGQSTIHGGSQSACRRLPEAWQWYRLIHMILRIFENDDTQW